MAISKVGLGWPVGERQYTTLAAWVTALKASGSYEEAWCSGNLGTSFVTITSSDFLQGARIWGDVQYTGANHAAIAALPRSITVNSTANILIQDISCTNPNSTQSAMNLSGANVVAERCYAWQAVDPGSNAATLMVTNYATASNCVAVNTLSTASKVIRPSANGIVKNCIGVGGKYALFSEWTSSKTEKSYGVGASISSCLWSKGRPPGNVTNASEDATGDVGYQNLDPVANFVDYANGDYRIRTTSPLYSAGIGAFFELASQPAYTLSINSSYPTYTVSGVVTNTKPERTLNISSTYSSYTSVVTADLRKPEYALVVSSTYSSYTATINSNNGKPVDTLSIDSTYPKYTALLNATGGINSYPLTVNSTYAKYGAVITIADVNKANIVSTYPAYSSSLSTNNTKPVKTTTVNASYPAYSVSSSFTAVPQGFSFAVNTTYPVYIANSDLTNIDPIDTVSILATYAMYSASALLDSDLPSKTVSITGTYPNYSVSVLVGSESTDKDLSINASYPKYIGTVVIGEFLSLPYRGGAGAHLNVSLGSREVVIKDKSREIKWRVENARL